MNAVEQESYTAHFLTSEISRNSKARVARTLNLLLQNDVLHVEGYMKRILLLAFAASAFVGCHKTYVIDTTPPTPPQGIMAVAMDGAVELSWYDNTEPDLAGYNVWISDRYDGEYEMLGSTGRTSYVDHGAKNGVRTYYAVTAYDFEGNESDLSRDVVYATPRPEGYGVRINDYRTAPLLAGYDFSTYTVGRYNDDYTDVFFEHFNGRFYLLVWDDTDIQDMGYTGSLYDIATAPSAGWSPSRTVEAIEGHTYVIWTWDDHYAKVRVREVTSTYVKFDWAYQTALGNPELKRIATNNGKRGQHLRALSELGK